MGALLPALSLRDAGVARQASPGRELELVRPDRRIPRWRGGGRRRGRCRARREQAARGEGGEADQRRVGSGDTQGGAERRFRVDGGVEVELELPPQRVEQILARGL